MLDHVALMVVITAVCTHSCNPVPIISIAAVILKGDRTEPRYAFAEQFHSYNCILVQKFHLNHSRHSISETKYWFLTDGKRHRFRQLL